MSFRCEKLFFSLTEEVDNAVVVAGEQANKISEEEHERRIDHAIGEVRRGHLEVQERIELVLQHWQSLDQLLSAHLSQRSAIFPVNIKQIKHLVGFLLTLLPVLLTPA